MTDTIEPQADDFAIDIRLRLPRDPYKRLRWIAEQKYQSTPARLAEAIVRAWLGGHFDVEPAPAEPKPKKLNDPGVREQLVEMLDAGMTVKDIAGNLDADIRAVHRWIEAVRGTPIPKRAKPQPKVKSAGHNSGHRPFSDPGNVLLFQRLYQEGNTDAAIAKALGCAESAVQRQRKMRGMLPQSERQYGAAS